MEMNRFVREYKKKSRRSMFIYYVNAILVIFLFLLTWMYLAAFHLSFVYLLIPLVCGLVLDVMFLNRSRRKNMDVINNLFKNNLDIDLVLECYEQLMNGKKGKDFPFIYVNYLKTLLLLGEYEKFIDVYKAYPKYSRQIDLSRLKSIVLSLKEDRGEYREALFEHKFSKYRNTNIKLSFRKEELKVTDQYVEIMQLYELKEYRKVIEKIDSINWYNTYNKLFYRSYRERSLYHLNEIYAAPDKELYPFAFVKQWKHLIETGEEYFYENVDELLKIFEQNEKKLKKTTKKIYIIATAYLLGMGILLAILTPEKQPEKADYIRDLSVWDYEATELYGFCGNDDLAGAILYGTRVVTDEDSYPDYYFTSIDYYREGLVPKTKLHISPLVYFGGTEVYSVDGEDSTYVTVITDELVLITYDKKGIKIEYDRLPAGHLSYEPYSYSFIVEGKFNKNLLGIEGKMLSPDGEFVDEKTVDPEELKKGVKLSASVPTEDGLVLFCSYRGNLSNVHTGAKYWLEEMTLDGWKPIEIEDDEERWKTHKYYLEEGEYTVIDINWGNVYYKVPAGQYRIGKDFTWIDNDSGNENTFPVYAEFEIK